MEELPVASQRSSWRTLAAGAAPVSAFGKGTTGTDGSVDAEYVNTHTHTHTYSKCDRR